MTKDQLRIVFFGTPEFAVESLDALVTKGFNVVGVVTMPDKAAGRGQKLSQSAVKKYALAHGLPVLQPEKLKDEALWRNCANYAPICLSSSPSACCPKSCGRCRPWAHSICTARCCRVTVAQLR